MADQTVRDHAWRVLREASRRRKFINEVLEPVRRLPASEDERRFLTALVYGVVRHRLTLDHLIETLSGVSMMKIQSGVIDMLRLGYYQTLFMPGVPPYAAVDSTVEMTKKELKGGAPRFVNAVMRNLQRAIDSQSTQDERRRLAVRPGEYVVFHRPVFPDPRRHPASFLSVQYSHPLWLVRRWMDHFGKEETARLCEADNLAPRVVLRVNTHRTTADVLREALNAEGIGTEPAGIPDALVADHTGDLSEVRAFREGMFQVQDETAMRVAPLLEPSEGGRYLDLCAAPGGKTTHLMDLIRDRGLIVAADRDLERLRKVADHVQRLKSGSIRLVVADGQYPPFRGSFDGILVDAPCSNTGVLARRPDARWRVRAKDLKEMPAIQAALLEACVPLLRPGGTLVYSTCSIEPEENELVVETFTANHPEFHVASQESILPAASHSGGFMARLRNESR